MLQKSKDFFHENPPKKGCLNICIWTNLYRFLVLSVRSKEDEGIILPALIPRLALTASGRDEDQQNSASGKLTPSTSTSIHSSLVMAVCSIQTGLKTASMHLKDFRKLAPIVWIKFHWAGSGEVGTATFSACNWKWSNCHWKIKSGDFFQLFTNL